MRLTIFVKDSFLDVWQDSKYASLIYHSFFGKIVDASKVDSIAMYIYSF